MNKLLSLLLLSSSLVNAGTESVIERIIERKNVNVVLDNTLNKVVQHDKTHPGTLKAFLACSYLTVKELDEYNVMVDSHVRGPGGGIALAAAIAPYTFAAVWGVGHVCNVLSFATLSNPFTAPIAPALMSAASLLENPAIAKVVADAIVVGAVFIPGA